jgi:glycosyltransferase involved in cell wall biosynthesis
VNILIVHNRYRAAMPSGENVVVDTESAALRLAGHQVSHFERSSDEIDDWSLTRKAMLPLSTVWSRSSRDALRAALRDTQPEVVHIHNTFPLLTASILSACADAEVPVVVTLHNYKLLCARGDFFRDGAICHDCEDHHGLPAIRHRCYRQSVAATTPVVVGAVLHRRRWRSVPSAYIFVSEAERRALAALRLPPERTFVKWNLVPRVDDPGCPPSDRVVYIGRLDEAKGLNVLMDAWERTGAPRTNPTLTLSIVGSGPLEAEVRAWSLRRNDVEVLGQLHPDECRRVLSGSRAAIVPSIWEETFGLVAVEAMSLGVPVVASSIGGPGELVRDGHEGALFDAGDAGALARVLVDIAARPGHWRDLGHASQVAYKSRFDPDANLDQLLDIYRFAITNPAARAFV